MAHFFLKKKRRIQTRTIKNERGKKERKKKTKQNNKDGCRERDLKKET